MVWLGGVIVLLTFVAIVKRYETRMVLFLSGLLMSFLAVNPAAAIDEFSAAMVNNGLVPVICTVMGFAFVMKKTRCDAHLVHLLAGFLTKFRAILIPGAVLVTFAVNIALPSAAGCAAAVGDILIPTLISAGIHPAIAACAVLAGTWGSVFNPGNAHNPFIAKLAGISDPMTVIQGHAAAALAGAAVVAAALTVVAALLKEDRSPEAPGLGEKCGEAFKVDYLMALVPVVPLLLLVLGSQKIRLLPWEVTVPQAMIFGVILAVAVTMRQPEDISRQFFAGMGDAYGNVIGIIIAAAVFTKGMALIGLTGELINLMKHSEQVAKVAATFGPFIVAVLSGSGDASTLAFNGAITPYAKQFGYEITQMGSQAFLSGALGRSMSPVAGATIVCATLAGVNPVEIAKRNAPGMIIAAVVTMLILL
ncbi:MAG: C4-dicarboxylate transporter DcuC [Negativicutes bacterium]|nr:C4-dicarboxylate transporter DcuC [Negativicutes bacterium]